MRNFSKEQRELLFNRSGGACSICRAPIDFDSFHADHVIPWSRGGKTTISNGAAVCPSCNLKKGGNMDTTKYRDIASRPWQVEAWHKAMNVFIKRKLDRFMLAAAPGAGKTRAATAIGSALMDIGAIDQIIVVSPFSKTAVQWQDVLAVSGITAGSLGALSDWRPGQAANLSITWGALGMRPERIAEIVRSKRTLAIFDELHHAADGQSWGAAALHAFDSATFKLKLSGTPFRSDDNRIIWFDYDDNGDAMIPEEQAYVLGYGDAVNAGYCRAVAFNKWKPDNIVVIDEDSGSIEQFDSIDGMSRKMGKTAIGAAMAWGVKDPDDILAGVYEDYLRSAHKELKRQRRQVDERAGGLVVCRSIQHAELTRKLLHRISGKMPEIVHSKLSDASSRIDAFDNSDDEWLISVAMVSEGTDVPRLRVLVWATNIESELYFRQVIGRIVRKRNEPLSSRSDSICFLPCTPTLMSYAERVELEIGYRVGGSFGNPVKAEAADGAVDQPEVQAEQQVDGGNTGDGDQVNVPEEFDIPAEGIKKDKEDNPKPPPLMVVVRGANRNGGLYRGDNLTEDQIAIGERIREDELARAQTPGRRLLVSALTAHAWFMLKHGVDEVEEAA